MEKKERYKLIYNDEELGKAIIDTEEDLSDDIHSWNILCDLLNQQDKEIKYFQKLNIEIIMQNKNIIKDAEIINQENQQLKQSQKELAINELEKAKNLACNVIIDLGYTARQINNFLDNQIKRIKEGK